MFLAQTITHICLWIHSHDSTQNCPPV